MPLCTDAQKWQQKLDMVNTKWPFAIPEDVERSE